MFTWDMYYIETARRENEIAEAMRDRYIKSITADCPSMLKQMSIQILDVLGSKLVQWGERMQCRCSELAMTQSNRAI